MIDRKHQEELKKIKNMKFPPKTKFEFTVENGFLWIEKIYVDPQHRGKGGACMSHIIAYANKHKLTVDLLADPTDKPSDPNPYDLVRWYNSFGFEPLSLTEKGIAMTKIPEFGHTDAKRIEDDAANRRRKHPYKREEYDALVEKTLNCCEEPEELSWFRLEKKASSHNFF